MDAIVHAVSAFPEGASVDDVLKVLDFDIPRRTLQRRMALLVEQGRLIPHGGGRSRRYRIPRVEGTSDAVVGRVEMEAHGEVYVPVSPAGQDIKAAVRRPIQERNPVGYQRGFLDAYRPNVTHYLPRNVRNELIGMGRLPDGERPPGTYARQIFNRLLIDLSWNSSRLEGNTYSLLEAERLLEAGDVAEGKDARDAQMILNHKAAIELLVEQAAEIGFNRYTILNLHGLLSDNLLADPEAGGRLRTRAVGIEGTVYHPLEVPQLVGECFERILAIATAIDDPYEQAFFAMVQLPYLQPFEDVNKRVSRLAANIPLIRLNLCPLSFVDVPERAYVDGILGVYELNRVDLLRDVFVWAYKRSSARYSAIRQSLGEPDPFRLRYRGQIGEVVAAVVRQRMNKRSAAPFIAEWADTRLPTADRPRFVEIAETELLSLHEGNVARYRLRESEYRAWRSVW